ncbi:hypothetical protein H1R20_g3721, partial [Candolleomyces eurysporus]
MSDPKHQSRRDSSLSKTDYTLDEEITTTKRPVTDIKEVRPSAETNPPVDKEQYQRLISGFSALCVAAGFVAAIQAQLLGLTNGKEDTTTTRAINALFLGAMLIDIMSAMMGYLTIRWLERMRDAEQELLNKVLQRKTNALRGQKRDSTEPKKPPVDFDAESTKIPPPSLAQKLMALSLLIPLPFLIIGVISMLVGIYIHIWSEHPTVVAIIVTVFGGITLPFILCDFIIGRKDDRRRRIIRRICELQGDW